MCIVITCTQVQVNKIEIFKNFVDISTRILCQVYEFANAKYKFTIIKKEDYPVFVGTMFLI